MRQVTFIRLTPCCCRSNQTMFIFGLCSMRYSYNALLLLLLLFLSPTLWSYEAPEDKKDLFARKACPAFLTFINAAYLAGVTVELPCHCKPEHVQSAVWFFRKHLAGSNETRVLSDHHGKKLLDTEEIPHSGDLQSRFFIRLFSLLIFRAGTDDSGIYICGSATRDFFYGYDVDIQGVQTLSFIARHAPESTTTGPKERRQQGPSYPLYQVFTSFQPWTVCDRCGVPGEQVRVGLCYVHSRYLHVRFKRASQTVASCGSGAVPVAFSHLKGGGATLEVKSCHVTCPTETPHSPKLLALKRIIGYSFASMPLEVPVFYLNHKADRPLTLGCPRARPNMAVAWDRGSETIYRSEHSPGRHVDSASNRLVIDSGHHLVFTPAKTEDSGIYYCWLQGRRAAEIRLLVYPHLSRGQSITSHPDFPLAVRVVLGSYSAMIAVFSLLLLGRAGVRHLRDARDRHVD